jgi:hypothetical protein
MNRFARWIRKQLQAICCNFGRIWVRFDGDSASRQSQRWPLRQPWHCARRSQPPRIRQNLLQTCPEARGLVKARISGLRRAQSGIKWSKSTQAIGRDMPLYCCPTRTTVHHQFSALKVSKYVYSLMSVYSSAPGSHISQILLVSAKGQGQAIMSMGFRSELQLGHSIFSPRTCHNNICKSHLNIQHAFWLSPSVPIVCLVPLHTLLPDSDIPFLPYLDRRCMDGNA